MTSSLVNARKRKITKKYTTTATAIAANSAIFLPTIPRRNPNESSAVSAHISAEANGRISIFPKSGTNPMCFFMKYRLAADIAKLPRNDEIGEAYMFISGIAAKMYIEISFTAAPISMEIIGFRSNL